MRRLTSSNGLSPLAGAFANALLEGRLARGGNLFSRNTGLSVKLRRRKIEHLAAVVKFFIRLQIVRVGTRVRAAGIRKLRG